MCQTQGLMGGSSWESQFLPAGPARCGRSPRLWDRRQAGARQGSREDQSVWEDVRHPRAGLPASSAGREWTGPDLLAAGPPHTSRGAAFCLAPRSPEQLGMRSHGVCLLSSSGRAHPEVSSGQRPGTRTGVWRELAPRQECLEA